MTEPSKDSAVETADSPDLSHDMDIQFPRLLSEIMATCELTSTQIDDLCDSMDCDRDFIYFIFDNADEEWQRQKLLHCPPNGGQI